MGIVIADRAVHLLAGGKSLRSRDRVVRLLVIAEPERVVARTLKAYRPVLTWLVSSVTT